MFYSRLGISALEPTVSGADVSNYIPSTHRKRGTLFAPQVHTGEMPYDLGEFVPKSDIDHSVGIRLFRSAGESRSAPVALVVLGCPCLLVCGSFQCVLGKKCEESPRIKRLLNEALDKLALAVAETKIDDSRPTTDFDLF